ncbi:nuclear transport factor 2 family protein [Nonomuraea sp. FMUSA5-5]|uniref:Nuclear transport factor 2 family protein n=1 Tax=Nonomuraea composti TaxID=2720023 RepID=A0ABX1AYY1_9ACTN|nr:nuclear transport factor 2 family protein [Nonomuraea sp. FMUSA5-5]NJP89392.1 nuclear transport factor 2 family protein [Nonomuraea sp. FMUSA5-5]
MDALERLSTVEDLRRLMGRYVRYADHQRRQDLASLFTPDGTFTPHKPDGSVWLRMRGREEIAATVGAGGGPGVTLIHHLFSDEIDVDSATGARGRELSGVLNTTARTAESA